MRAVRADIPDPGLPWRTDDIRRLGHAGVESRADLFV